MARAAAARRDSVTFNDGAADAVTIVFDRPRPVRRYADGQWAVEGPVRIIAMLPPSAPAGRDEKGDDRWVHGAELQPRGNGAQGFDDRRGRVGQRARYDHALNVDPGATGAPLDVFSGATVVKALSAIRPLNERTGRGLIRNYAILTVVDALPPADAFRPPVRGGDKVSRWTIADLDLSVLRDLAPPSSAPRFGSVLNAIGAGPRLTWRSDGGGSRNLHSHAEGADYTAYIAKRWLTAALWLHLAAPAPQKRALLTHLVQIGIDHWGAATDGAFWEGRGGLGSGRKITVLTAGLALGDAEILRWADRRRHDVWGDDRQHFVVSEADVARSRLRERNEGRPIRLPYAPEHVGFPEWGEQHSDKPARDSAAWGALYRTTGFAVAAESALAADLCRGGREAWGHPAYFDYVDRAFQLDDAGFWDSAPGQQRPSAFGRDMRRRHRAATGAPIWTVDRPEQAFPPQVERRGARVVARLGGLEILNGRPLTRRDLRWSADDGARWTEIRGVDPVHVLDVGRIDGEIRVQVRLVTDHPGAWSVNRPRAVGGRPRAVAGPA